MRVLWLCNMAPGVVNRALGGDSGNGLWIDHVLGDSLKNPGMELYLLFPDSREQHGTIGENLTYRGFAPVPAGKYAPELEDAFTTYLEKIQPDLVHIWGTEYGHTLAMVRSCRSKGCNAQTVISIQGLCSMISRVYCTQIPESVCRFGTLRDFLRQDNLLQQQKTFARRGKLEAEALKLANNVIGRTDWDRACTRWINPNLTYYTCRETLREEFYTGNWEPGKCQRHRIFASSCLYPIKGFHLLLDAFAIVCRRYPDASLAVPGRSCFPCSIRDKLLIDGYRKYLSGKIRNLGLEKRITFLGQLSGEEMKEQMLRSNVFCLPSFIENSPNTLGEAMLLGMPCVASDVGGVSSMLNHGREGLLYPSDDPYLLAEYICRVFEQDDMAAEMGRNAKIHAAQTHDPERNFRGLMNIYENISGNQEAKT